MLEKRDSSVVEPVIGRLSRDYLLIKLLPEEEALWLAHEFLEISEKIKDELCSLLEGYGEITADNTSAEKIIRSVIETNFDWINNSNALVVFKAYLKYQVNKDSRTKRRLFQKEKFNEILVFLEAKDFDLFRFVESDAFDIIWSITRNSILPWMPSKRRPFVSYNGLSTRTLNIPTTELLALCNTSQEKNMVCSMLGSPGSEESGICISYFSQDFNLKVLDELVTSVEASAGLNSYLSGAISKLINENCEQTDKNSETYYGAYSHGNREVENVDQSKLKEIAELYRDRSLVDHIKKAEERVLSYMPEKEFDAFKVLNESADNFFRSLFLLAEKRSALSAFLGDGADQLNDQIYKFLSDNDLNPLSIPTIAELGKKKGGYALVKSISERGGLKIIRKQYVRWAMKKLNTTKENPLEKRDFEYEFEPRDLPRENAEQIEFDKYISKSLKLSKMRFAAKYKKEGGRWEKNDS